MNFLRFNWHTTHKQYNITLSHLDYFKQHVEMKVGCVLCIRPLLTFIHYSSIARPDLKKVEGLCEIKSYNRYEISLAN